MTWHGLLFKELEIAWRNLRKFSFNNRTIFEIFFIIIYTLEQGLLIYLSFNAKDNTELTLIVSIFAIIVLTTFALHKILMESRIKMLEKELNLLREEKQSLEGETNRTISTYKLLFNQLQSQLLNKPNHSLKKKRGVQ